MANQPHPDGPWVNSVTPIDADNLNRIEANTASAHARLDTLEAGGGSGGSVQPLIHHDFAGDASGALNGRTLDSGQTVDGTGSNPPVVRDGMVTFAAGAPVGASYARVISAGTVTRIGGTFKFGASQAATGVLTLGAFTGSQVTAGDSPCHLSITPTGMEYAVFIGGANYAVLAPNGDPRTTVEFPEPLSCDGTTEYHVEIFIDHATGEAFVIGPGRLAVTYRDPRIATAVGTTPFWETFTQSASDAVGGFTRIWADTAATSGSDYAPRLAAARALCRPRGGAGPATTRPASAVSAGASWWNTDAGRAEFSDGSTWRDITGKPIANLLTVNRTYASKSVAGMYYDGGTVDRVAAPQGSGRGSGYLLTSNGGVVQFAGADLLCPVTPGETISALAGKTRRRGSTARSGYIQLTFFDASNGYVSALPGPAYEIPQTSPGPCPVFTTTVPSTATQVAIAYVALAGAAGEQFEVTELCIARGTITGFVNP